MDTAMTRRTRALVIFLVASLAVLISALALLWGRAFTVRHGSMEPLLRRGDRILISKRVSSIRNHEVVIFRWPTDDPSDARSQGLYIARVVGLPGQTVELRNGQLLVDGVVQNEPFVQHTGPTIDGATRVPPEAMAHLNSYGPARIPDGHVFVMGDNRDRAADSRFHGPVPITNITGKVILIVSGKSGIHTVSP